MDDALYQQLRHTVRGLDGTINLLRVFPHDVWVLPVRLPSDAERALGACSWSSCDIPASRQWARSMGAGWAASVTTASAIGGESDRKTREVDVTAKRSPPTC